MPLKSYNVFTFQYFNFYISANTVLCNHFWILITQGQQKLKIFGGWGKKVGGGIQIACPRGLVMMSHHVTCEVTESEPLNYLCVAFDRVI